VDPSAGGPQSPFLKGPACLQGKSSEPCLTWLISLAMGWRDDGFPLLGEPLPEHSWFR
jgi:hypothetical protein